MTVPAHVALDQSVCIRSQSNIGETILHNICDGTTAVVPWGTADWAAAITIGGLFLALTLLLAGIATMVISEFVRSW